MQNFTKHILICFIVTAFIGCKKKADPVYIDREVHNDEIFGSFSCYVNIFGPAGNADSADFGASASFYKSPFNSMKVYPPITFVRMGNQTLGGFQGFPGFYTLSPLLVYNAPELFKSLTIEFHSDVLGGHNFIVDENVQLPQFSKSFGDTLVLSKSTPTSFSIISSSNGFKGSVLKPDYSYDYQEDLKDGMNVIKLDPASLSMLNEIIVYYVQKRSFFIRGKRYLVDKQYLRHFPVKWVN